MQIEYILAAIELYAQTRKSTVCTCFIVSNTQFQEINGLVVKFIREK